MAKLIKYASDSIANDMYRGGKGSAVKSLMLNII